MQRKLAEEAASEKRQTVQLRGRQLASVTRRIKFHLKAKKCLTGPADGEVTPAFKSALKSFADAARYSGDGRLGGAIELVQ